MKYGKKIRIRKTIFFILTLIAYFFTIIYLFWFHDLLWSIVCIFFTFISFHFLFLDIKNTKFWKMILYLLWLFAITLIIFIVCNREINLFIILWALTLNVSLWALFYSLWMVDFDSISYFMRWWYIFSLIITTMYSISLIWMFQEFPFSCDWLEQASNKLIEFVEKPFTLTLNKLNKNKDINEIKDNNSSGLNNFEINDNSWTGITIITKINEIKESTIEQIMNEQESYNDNVCDMLLWEINSKFWSENFKRSVILLTYLLLYWFIRISFRIMSWFAFVLFKILYWCRIYKIKKIKKNVDEIF